MLAQVPCIDNSSATCTLHGVCFGLPEGCFYDGMILMSIFVSMTGQYGTAGGTLYDPVTMQPLYNTTAMAEALRIWGALMQTSHMQWSDGTLCERPSEAYYLRHCAWGFSLATFWKLFDFAFDGYLRGRIATAVLPGSHRVLDRTTGKAGPLLMGLLERP